MGYIGKKVQNAGGAAILEFVIAVPFTLFIIANLVDIGDTLSYRFSLLQAARDGAQLGARTMGLAEGKTVCPDGQGCTGDSSHIFHLARARDILNLTKAGSRLDDLVYTSERIINGSEDTLKVTISGSYVPIMKFAHFKLPFKVEVFQPYIMSPSSSIGASGSGIALTSSDKLALSQNWQSDMKTTIAAGYTVGGAKITSR